MTVYILGGGPTGLALAQGLSDHGQNFVLIERDSDLGGLAKTVSWAKIGDHDLGPHKIFSMNEALNQRVNSLIDAEQWVVRDKKATIFMGGQYLPYPPSPFALLHIYGPVTFLKMCIGFGLAKIFGWMRAPFAKSFEQDLRARVGLALYDKLFRPIAEKLWGDPRNLDLKLSQGRVQIPSVFEIIRGILGIKSNSSFEALEFSYPKGGLKMLWQAISKNISSNGQILANHAVQKLLCDSQGNIDAIEVRDLTANETKKITLSDDDYIVSTLPLALNARLLGDKLSEAAHDIAQNVVKLNDLVLVFLHIEADELTENSWIFIPDPDIIFHRVSEQNSFDVSMVPSGSIVCCEVMSSSQRPLADRPDDELVASCLDDLEKLGLGRPEVKASKVTRLPKSYPVYQVGFETQLKTLIGEFDALPNFKTIGRQGAFNYIGTLDAMDIGFGAAEWIVDREKDWQLERERTEHFPVLD
jgi:protoporphyrinogen oxidase